MADIWVNDTYTNQNIPYLFNTKIYEYDMRDAGFSLTQEFKLLDSKTIEKLANYKKEKRKIELGLIQRSNEKYRNDLKLAFREARRLFFLNNGLDDNDIISVKKDAIFTTKKCTDNTIGDFIEFRVKNDYTSYIKLDRKFEFYYKNGKVDVKGMNDECLELHKDYMLKFISTFFDKMETFPEVDVIKFTKRFIDKYKRRELEVGYYRTFDFNSHYLLLDDDQSSFTEYWEEEKEDLDISYNFKHILLKLIQIPL